MSRRNSFLVEQGLSLAWVVATVATIGSLYFSEIEGYIPCNFCWYQRILMYPLVIILGIATARKDFNQIIYVLPISIIGMGISSTHNSTPYSEMYKTIIILRDSLIKSNQKVEEG